MCDCETDGRVEQLESLVEELVKVTQWNSMHHVGSSLMYDQEWDTCEVGETGGVAYVTDGKAVVPLWVSIPHQGERELVEVDLDRFND